MDNSDRTECDLLHSQGRWFTARASSAPFSVPNPLGAGDGALRFEDVNWAGQVRHDHLPGVDAHDDRGSGRARAEGQVGGDLRAPGRWKLIFASSADKIMPNYRGVHDDVVRPAFGRALGRIEEGDKSVDQAWSEAVTEAKRAPGKQTK